MGKNHRQFRNFVSKSNNNTTYTNNCQLYMFFKKELEDAPSNVSWYSIVRWLSTSNVMSRFVDLLQPINLFLDEILASPEKILSSDKYGLSSLMFFHQYNEASANSQFCTPQY